MSDLKRRSSFGDAHSRSTNGGSGVPGTCDNDNDKVVGPTPGARKRLMSKAQKVGEYMFKSGVSIPTAHASFGSPSLSYNPHLSTTAVGINSLPQISKSTSPNSSTLFFVMPRSDNFQGLPAPFFSADTYYFAGNTNPAAKQRSTKSKPRTSLSSDSAQSQTSKATSIPGGLSKDDSAVSASHSLARAHSTTANYSSSSHRLTNRKRPSTATPSTSRDPGPQIISSASSTDIVQLPVIAGDDKLGISSTSPLPDSTTIPATMPRFVIKNGRRHHPYLSSKAPYPRSYDSTSIDHDTSTHLFFATLCKSVTFHEFSTPPANVLDLGCGNGVWVLDAAKAWPHSNFVGLDLMPLQPNLSLVAPQLQDRIQWRIANFLDPLPFEDNHFDFVHIRRIARGVPENKWPLVLEEVSRVLKPDGALEVVEEDLIFPGGQEPCTCHYPPDVTPPGDTDEPSSHQIAGSSSHDHESEHYENAPDPDAPGPNTKTTAVDAAHPFYYSSPAFNSRDHSKLEEAYNDMHSSKFINLMPISVLTETLAHYFRDVRSHPPVLVTFPPPEEEMWSDESASGNEGSMVSTGGTQQPPVPTAYPPRIARKSRPSTADSSVGSSGGSPTRSFPPFSPISPLSDSRQSMSSPATAEGSLFALMEDADGNTPEVAAAAAAANYMTHPPIGGWHTLHLDVRALVHPRQPFIMIDRCRMPARGYGPPYPTLHTAIGGDSPIRSYGSGQLTKLPNQTFDLDLQSLTLLLSQSVTDVLECSEAIWEYLVDQGKARTKRPPRPPMYSYPLSSVGTSNAASSNGRGMVDREEFDHWISKYEKEMHARIGMAAALRRRFGWETKGLTSDYVVQARPYAMSTTTPITVVPISALSATPPRPRLLGDPFPEDVITGHSSSSVSLIDEQDGDHTTTGTGAMRQMTGSGPEHPKAGKHVARSHTQVGDAGHHSHSRSNSLDGAHASEVIGGGDGEGGNGEIGSEGAGELEGELPRLSRCIRVFVAWNGKD